MAALISATTIGDPVSVGSVFPFIISDTDSANDLAIPLSPFRKRTKNYLSLEIKEVILNVYKNEVIEHPTTPLKDIEKIVGNKVGVCATSVLTYNEYFDLVKEIISNIPPERIYNLDETSFCLDPSRVKVVGEKEKTAHRFTVGPSKENFYALMGGNATREKLLPLIIFKGKNLWDTWLAKEDDEYSGASINRWMETETFSNYIEHTFLPNIPKERPVVLIYDGHSSYTSITLIETALREDIIILKLPPHTSHLLQPMDLAVFNPLKQNVR
ncbi:uncharacterized protein [Diabrotica undecimpunctata]|uniref:uncharacterized protein n=1 Tax=Diabrotica undecimpunctata TaxID=50387 RepID=UPI003B636DCD